MISSTATFAVSDIVATLAYYKDVLGFETVWTWGDPPVFGSASSGGVTIAFSLQPELASKVRGHQHGIKVEDVDELYRLYKSRGAHIVEDIEDKPWGMREYVVEDPNGYRLHFSGLPASNAPESSPFPEGITIERRKPKSDEFMNVAGRAFEYKALDPAILDNTWSGIVATTRDGACIGVLRIMLDAPGWFSIWDVAVLPDWQAHRIGSTMMKEALQAIREVSPGATVHLFTYKDGFYERLGFVKASVCIRRV